MASSADFFITDSAAQRILEILKNEKGAGSGFRIAVLGGGCSGFQYEYDYSAHMQPDDLVFEHGEAKVFIDEMSFAFLGGATLNYSVDLGGAHFEVKNPNATAKCGCNNSFAL
jgi:iron-sulfur cluster insertion protein